MNTLKFFRKKKGETQAEVAAAIGVDRTTYVKYESGASEPSFEMLQRMAEHFGCYLAELMGEAVPPPASDRVRIPVLGRVAAGIPIDAVEEVIDWEELDASEYGTGEYFGLKIRGKSMEPKISDGDVVIVRRQDDVNNGDIAIVLVNGDEGTCKRIKKSPQGVVLLSNNPAYEPMYFSNEEIERLPVKVIGRVVELRAKF